MPRFHFNVRDAFGAVRDPDGLDLPHIEAAREEAIKGARAMIAEEVLRGRLDLKGVVEVTDSTGAVLLTLPFGEAVGLRRTACSRLIIDFPRGN